MATASRQRVTVDLHGAADRLHSLAAARHMTTAAVVRMAIRQALDGQVYADSTVTQPRPRPHSPHEPVRPMCPRGTTWPDCSKDLHRP